MFWKVKALARDLVTKPVVASSAARLRVERGSLDAFASPALPEKVAIVAAWSHAPAQSLSLSRYLQELHEAGFWLLVVSTADFAEPLQWPHGIPASAVVLRRENSGYDFGSWAAVLHALPQIRRTDTVLLTNDSLVGPFWSLRPIFQDLAQSRADVVGLTDSTQLDHTLQSYFLAFKHGVLAEPPWRRFFANIRPQATKMGVVYRYEAAIVAKCRREGYAWEAQYPARALRAGKANPSLVWWRELLQAGTPFVKRTLFTEPKLAAEGEAARRFLAEEYGIAVEEWLPASSCS